MLFDPICSEGKCKRAERISVAALPRLSGTLLLPTCQLHHRIFIPYYNTLPSSLQVDFYIFSKKLLFP
jgi:hypothetical protein